MILTIKFLCVLLFSSFYDTSPNKTLGNSTKKKNEPGQRLEKAEACTVSTPFCCRSAVTVGSADWGPAAQNRVGAALQAQCEHGDQLPSLTGPRDTAPGGRSVK